MATIQVQIESAIGVADVNRLCRNPKLSKYQTLTNLLNYITGLQTGVPFRPAEFQISDLDDAVAATGVVTPASAQAADTVTVNGVVFTAVSGTPAANQFDISGTNTQAAESLVAAINTTATALAQLVVASNVGAAVTIAARTKGTVGNAYTLASSNGTRLPVTGTTGGRLTGGTDDADALTLTF